jgi:peptidoglycan/LPS O-acetylase OafA/YrhL
MQHVSTAFIYSITGLTSPVNLYLGLSAHYAVIFFFALSGYVITLSIHSNINRNHRFNVFEYAASRYSRILPPLIGAILFSLLLYIVLNYFDSNIVAGSFAYKIRDVFNPDIITQIKSLLTLTMQGDLIGGNYNVNGALWSLVYEIQFYLYAALIAIFITANNIIYKLVCVVLFVCFGYETIHSYALTIQITSYICFALGGFSFIYQKKLIEIKYLPLIVFLFMLISIGIQTEWSNPLQKMRDSISLSGSWMIHKIIMGFFFSLLIVHIGKIGSVISLFHSLSPFSYSLYITHFPIVVFLWFLISNKAPYILEYKYSLAIITIIICIVFAKYFGVIFENPKKHRKSLMELFKKIKAQ